MTDRLDPADGTPRPRPAPAGSVVDMRDAPPTALRPDSVNAAPAEAAPPVGSTLVGTEGGGLPPMHPRSAAPGNNATVVPRGGEPSPAPLPPAHPQESLMEENPMQGTASAPDRPDRPAPPPKHPAPAPAPRRGGFAPLFLGGLVAAGVGAGAAWWAIPRLPPAWRPVPAQGPAIDTAALTEAAVAAARADLDRRAADLESRAAETATRAATEAARQAAAEAASQAAAAGLSGESLVEQARQAGSEAAARLIAEAPAKGQADGALSAALAAQAQQLAALDQRVAALAERPQEAPAPAVDLAPIRQQLDQLAQRPVLDPAAAERLARLAEGAEAATARIDQAAAAAEQRLHEAESRAAALGEAADAAARSARAAAAAAALAEAVQTGSPRAAALAQLQDAGVQPPAALTADIPTLDALAADFPAAARAALRADLRSGAAGGTGSVIGNFLRAQTGARSVAPRPGTDADAVLSRAQDAVQRGAIGKALTELDALPAAARPAMQPWIDRARRYADAQAALTSLSAPQGEAPDTAEQGDPAPAPPAPAPTTDSAAAGAPAAPAAPSN